MEKTQARFETVKLIQRILDKTDEEFADILDISRGYWTMIRNGKAPFNGEYYLMIQDRYPELCEKAEKILSLNLHKVQANNTNNGGNHESTN